MDNADSVLNKSESYVDSKLYHSCCGSKYKKLGKSYFDEDKKILSEFEKKY